MVPRGCSLDDYLRKSRLNAPPRGRRAHWVNRRSGICCIGGGARRATELREAGHSCLLTVPCLPSPCVAEQNI